MPSLSASETIPDASHAIEGLTPPLFEVGANTYTFGRITVGQSVYGNLSETSDHDWYKIELKVGETYAIRLLGVGQTPVEDTQLRVRDSTGKLLDTNDNAYFNFGYNSALAFTATGYIGTNTFYIDAGGRGAGDFLLTVAANTGNSLVLTADEVAWQLTNNYERDASFSDINMPATAYDLSGGRTLTYNVSQLNAAGQALAVQALRMWSDITGITFQQTTAAAQLNFDDSETDVTAYNSNVTSEDGTITSSALMVSLPWLAEFGKTLNSYSFETMIHEIGHALGLGHGGNYNGSATYGYDNYYANDSQHLSIMSYMQSNYDEFARDLLDVNTFVNAQFRWVLTPMIADILAMQTLYGLSTTTRTGDTTYGYNSNTGNAALDQAVTLNDPRNNNYVAFTIFDNGGTDTVDMSGYAGAQVINLTPGASSDVLGGRQNMGVAYGTVVENAYGGGGNDGIFGNHADNLLRGGAGDDHLHGGKGNDTLDAGIGKDGLDGGDGNDLLRMFTVSNSGAGSLDGGTGIDTVDFSGVTANPIDVNLDANGYAALVYLVGYSYSSLRNVENVMGSVQSDEITGGDGGNKLSGMAGDDTINGGRGNDTLEGGAGRDTLVGGSGDDVFYYGDGDTLIEHSRDGTDLVYSDVNCALALNFENLQLSGSAAINGFGNASANLIIGNEGNNSLYGGAGADTLRGGAGNDRLNGEKLDAAFDPAMAQVYRLYQSVLGRAPDQAGLLGWAEKIASGALSLQQVANSLVGSAEFQIHYGQTSNAGFVTLLYDNVLHRAPDAGGLASWTGALDAGKMTRAQVVTGFSESAEFNLNTVADTLGVSRAGYQADWTDEVYRLYLATLDRAPDLGGLTSWTLQLAQGSSFLSVVEGFTDSAEFVGRYGATTDADFVTLLYRNVLDREPDSPGLSGWTAKLADGTLTRAQVVRSFAMSTEFVQATTDGLTRFMWGSMADDRLEAGLGDDVLFGGIGVDTFELNLTAKGHHIVADLEAWDRIEITGFGALTTAEMRSHFSQVGDDAVFSFLGVTVSFADTAVQDIGSHMAGYADW